MGLLTDILKEIPQAAVLKEKIASIEAKYAAADTENAILKDDLREANAKIKQLEGQIKQLTHKDDLNEIEIEILLAVSKSDSPSMSKIAKKFDIHSERVLYYVGKLSEQKYLKFIGFGGDGLYLLEQKGREALMNRDLI